MDKLKLLKLLQERMKSETGQAVSGGLNAINSAIPNIQQNEIIQGKTGFGNATESVIQAGADAFLPGAGAALGMLSKVGSAVEGDGTSTGKNIVGELINPLSNINDLVEGRAKYAIPIVGSFLKARDSKNNLAFTADKQLGESINESKNLNAAYPTFGVNNVQRFELGGSIPLSKDTSLLQGATHQQGGIPLMKEGQQIGEAENNELLINTGDNAHIATDKLINPKTNNSFAVDIAKIKQEQGKYEKLQEKRPADGTLKNVIDKSKAETEVLIEEQEMTKQKMLQMLKQQMGTPEVMPQQNMPEFELGGKDIDDPRYLALMKEIEARKNAAVAQTGKKIGEVPNTPFLDNTTEKVSQLSLPETPAYLNPFGNAAINIQHKFAKIQDLPTVQQNIDNTLATNKANFEAQGNKLIAKQRDMVFNSLLSQTTDFNIQQLQPKVQEAFNYKEPNSSLLQEGIGMLKPFADKVNNVPADILTGLANAFDRRKDKAPQKEGLNYLSPLKVDYGSQKEQAIRSSESTLKALNNNISDATTGRAASLASLSERIGSINNINEAETNTNMQLLQDVLGKNSQIQGLNNETKFSNEVLGQQFKDDKRAKNLQLASRIANESSQRKRDANADKLANTQNKIRVLTESDPRVLEDLIKSGTIAEVFPEEEVENFKLLLEKLKKGQTTETTK